MKKLCHNLSFFFFPFRNCFMKPTGKCFFHECCQEARDQDKTRYVPSCALEKIVMADFGKHVESCFSVTKTLHIHCHHAYGHQNWHSGDLSWGTNTHKVLTRVRIIKRCQNSFAFLRNGENEYCQTPFNHFI